MTIPRTLWGRQKEFKRLSKLTEKETSSLAVLMGRRRIGKSTLAKTFGETFRKRYFFEGLAPHDKQTNSGQLDHFARQLSQQTQTPGFHFKDWDEAFEALAQHCKRGPAFVLFDEISWMGAHDPEFCGKLKFIWDQSLKSNPKLILVLCGSVSAWIQKNILNSSDFVGRVSLQMNLQELPLSSVLKFTGRHQVPTSELLRILCVTGCIPKYLEEVRYQASAQEEIQRLCFSEDGFLFNEFDKIFRDIFQKRVLSFRKVVALLVERRLSGRDIAKGLGQTLNSDISEMLRVLVLSGFLARDYVHCEDGTRSKKSTYRLKDNYLRFYLKYIEPLSETIQQDDELLSWSSIEKRINGILGLQFENLVLNHLSEVLKALQIPSSLVVSASPYFQRATAKNKGATQVDLLIQCRNDLWYLCEIKFQKKIPSKVIAEVQNKLHLIKKPKKIMLRTALIYYGELSPEVGAFFDRCLSFEKLLVSEDDK
ncbi:ATP-binding protein [Bdellovibrionota bacterium FG-1]